MKRVQLPLSAAACLVILTPLIAAYVPGPDDDQWNLTPWPPPPQLYNWYIENWYINWAPHSDELYELSTPTSQHHSLP
jgi:hypothetical protein